MYTFKRKLHYVSYYLIGNIILDLLSQLFKHFNNFPKPYTGTGFILFNLSTICYLANAAGLLFWTGKSLANKTLQQMAPIALISCMIAILISYPALSGVAMLAFFYAFYGVTSITSFVAILIKIGRITINQIIFLMLSLGGIAEILLMVIFGYQHYWFVYLCNGIFYLAIIFISSILTKYSTLLKL